MAETERLNFSSEIFVINGTEMNIDVYVNYETQATLSDPTPMSVGPVFVVKDTFDRPYGVYTFSVRLKDDAGGPVLAAASIDMQQGHSFSGVFHRSADGGFQFSIYENDLSVGTEARLTVRNTSNAAEADWSLVPNGENPEVPRDERSGTIANGEWQICRGVEVNDYLFEYFINGQRVARNADTGLGLEQNIIAYLIGTPQPTSNSDELRRHVIFQELEYDVGPAVQDSISPATPPLSASDQNASIQFDCPSTEVWETNPASVAISALDPDSVVNQLTIRRVDPKVDGFTIPDSSFSASAGIGQPATAEVSIDAAVPDGEYTVSVEANAETMAQSAVCPLEVMVKRITMARLEHQVDRFVQSGDLDPAFGDTLKGDLSKVQRHLKDDQIARACSDLNKFLGRIESKQGSKINEAAATALTREANALSVDLACG